MLSSPELCRKAVAASFKTCVICFLVVLLADHSSANFRFSPFGPGGYSGGFLPFARSAEVSSPGGVSYGPGYSGLLKGSSRGKWLDSRTWAAPGFQGLSNILKTVPSAGSSASTGKEKAWEPLFGPGPMKPLENKESTTAVPSETWQNPACPGYSNLAGEATASQSAPVYIESPGTTDESKPLVRYAADAQSVASTSFLQPGVRAVKSSSTVAGRSQHISQSRTTTPRYSYSSSVERSSGGSRYNDEEDDDD